MKCSPRMAQNSHSFRKNVWVIKSKIFQLNPNSSMNPFLLATYLMLVVEIKVDDKDNKSS